MHFIRSRLWNASLFLTWLASVNGDCIYHQDLAPEKMYYVYNPGFPDWYPPGTSCRWDTSSRASTWTNLNCSIDIPASDNCEGDSVEISWTGDQTGTDRYCGYRNVLKHTKANLSIVLMTGSDSRGGKFLCELRAINEERPCDCGRAQHQKFQSRIVGGEETAPNEYPMMAGLVDRYEGTIYCGATIISSRHVLTAAHCVVEKDVGNLVVVVGEHDVKTGSETKATRLFRVHSIDVHPDYLGKNVGTRHDDVAVVRVNGEFTYNQDVGPVCLPLTLKEKSFVGETVVVIGWGATTFGGERATRLRQAKVDVVSNADCAKSYQGISESEICTYYAGRDACQFDSGGPVMWRDVRTGRYYLLGVISYGKACASKSPGVNARVTPYLDWIRKVTEEKLCHI